MDASLRLECLDDTRQDTLEFVANWLMAPSDDQNILWLYGVAGCGKSTISTTIARYFRDLGRLGAFLFFNRNNASDEPNTVIRTLSYQLASFDPVINAAVCAQIERNPTIIDAPLHDQFVELLQEPLKSHPGLNNQGPIVIIFDALDECASPESRRDLLRILSRELAKLPLVFRFFITSRMEIDIATAFMDRHNIMVRELDTYTEANTSDIALYLHHSFATIRQMFALETYWPGEERILALTKHSAGLFVFAYTAIKFIGEGPDPNNQLDIILQQYPGSPESTLDALYAAVLNQMPWEEEEFTFHFRTVMGAVVVGKEPLSDTTLDRILGMDIETTTPSARILSHMGSLLSWNPGQGVRLLHPSFADYLTDHDRCGNQPWFIEKSIACQRLAVGCIRTMKTELKFNICQLDTSFVANDEGLGLDDRIGYLISPHLKYACCFWADHLQTTNSVPEIAAVVEDFLFTQFLYWLEVMSLIKEVVHASQALQITARWASLANNNEVVAFATDAHIFVSTFSVAISRSTPHIYMSALPFSPTESIVAKRFLPLFPRAPSIEVGRAVRWPAFSLVIEGHKATIFSVAFSPDGKRIVTGSSDRTAQVWDSETGTKVAAPFTGHKDVVFSVAYGPDNTRIVSGSADKTILVWDGMTSEKVSGPFIGHEEWVLSVNFSPDMKRIVSTSADQTVRVWDISTGTCLLEPFREHTAWVFSAAFSPDGTRIVSGSRDKTIRVWDSETGICKLGPLIGHTEKILSVAISPDGTRIVSGSQDNTVRVWDIQTGEQVAEPLKGHMGWVLSVTFSPDARWIISGSRDETIRIWDAEIGQAISEPLVGHMDAVWSVSFSPDGKRIASGSKDCTARVWDASKIHGAFYRSFYQFVSTFCAKIPKTHLQMQNPSVIVTIQTSWKAGCWGNSRSCYSGCLISIANNRETAASRLLNWVCDTLYRAHLGQSVIRNASNSLTNNLFRE
ncbi:hypothetical protein PILCRDRAFT_67515 [Piloderma croceum F 1598]|uniref:Nephrocystin 3-like N-terminal domain-containing protein n=1 Tax=Piloderma croceum (strain F 1598) TaxID=765440 RepID=A0A0C3BEJ2_PILCF|nr:hypothetical protein PILCRDRAFT_67515 [Piloderma croceum F 1598]